MQNPRRFAWREPPYEYEYVKPPIDILCGTDSIRETIDAGRSPRRLGRGWPKQLEDFLSRRQRHLLY